MESAATAIPTAVDEGERPSLADGGDWKDRTTGQIAKLIEACWAGPLAERPAFGGAEGVVALREAKEDLTDTITLLCDRGELAVEAAASAEAEANARKNRA